MPPVGRSYGCGRAMTMFYNQLNKGVQVTRPRFFAMRKRFRKRLMYCAPVPKPQVLNW
jgi:hypothetical protein